MRILLRHACSDDTRSHVPSQAGYIQQMLNRFNLNDVALSKTPTSPRRKLYANKGVRYAVPGTAQSTASIPNPGPQILHGDLGDFDHWWNTRPWLRWRVWVVPIHEDHNDLLRPD